jgi:hypothetical protein
MAGKGAWSKKSAQSLNFIGGHFGELEALRGDFEKMC